METKNKDFHSILLIDDDPDDFELLTEAFTEIDPMIHVEYLLGNNATFENQWDHFDLVLLDINMPKKDGFEWLTDIRQNGNRNLPVVMYTNSLSPVHIAKAYNEGADLYFPKPETYASLKKGLTELIRMDWSDPTRIKRQYEIQGQFTTFSPNLSS